MSSPLSSSNSSIKVMNAALAELGISPITTFLDNSIAARTGNALFNDILEEALSSYPWRFARDRITLAALPGDAPAPWNGMFALPTSALAVHSIWEDDQKAAFDVYGRKVALMAAFDTSAVIKADVTITVDPSLWPGYFRRAFILKLAAAICMPITQDERTAGFALQRGERSMMQARSRDAQGRTPSRIDTKGFIRARRGGRR